MPISTRLWLIARIGEGANGGLARLRERQIPGAGDGRPAPGGCRWRRGLRRSGRSGSIDNAGQAAEARLRDLSKHQVVRRTPGVAAGLAGRLLAGNPQCALLVLIVHFLDPGVGCASMVDLGGVANNFMAMFSSISGLMITFESN